MRIRGYREHHSSYPHTPTVRQWFEWERFEAYRLLGHRMAAFYLKDVDLDSCRFAPDPSS